MLVAGASVFLPANNPTPQAARIDAQGVAYASVGERSVSLVVENPGPSFHEFPPPAYSARVEITLKASHCIHKQSAHQAHERFRRSRAAPRGVEQRWHKRIGTKFVACRTHRVQSHT
jgi:hypothetical protein